MGGFTIWGVDGDKVTAADFAYDAAAKTLTVNTDKHFAIRNTDQEKEASGPYEGHLAHLSPVGIVIPASRNAHITLANVAISAAVALDIRPDASCSLILADGTANRLEGTQAYKAALHCPTGASLTIDDALANIDKSGNPLVPENGVIPRDAILSNGAEVKKGDPLTKLDSEEPGKLHVWAASIGGAGIGSDTYETGGSITINGGDVFAGAAGFSSAAADAAGSGIGGGEYGNGTGAEEWITINGGQVHAQGSFHSPGIGGGASYRVTGNIRINGGYVISVGGPHGAGFGNGCDPADSTGYQIVITGGTLIPVAPGGTPYPVYDVGAPGASTVITGGSLGNGAQSDIEVFDNGAWTTLPPLSRDFVFGGTAQNDKDEPIAMVEVDLTSDVGKNTYKIVKWQLLVDGVPYDYGAPAEFDKGHLYLWLPETVKQNSEVTVQFTYLDSDDLDESGNPTEKTPLPLFRPPGDTTDGKLRRYVDFTLDADYLASLDKYYDGKAFPVFPLPLRTPDGRDLTRADKIDFKYQRLDSSGNPVGAESGNGADAGTMKFTAISTQYSDDTEGNFSESYWGHRATGTCTIRPIASQVSGIAAEWVGDGKPGDVAHPSDQVLKVSATIGAAPTVDGRPGSEETKPTCQAPRGRVQIYVDGEPVGEPVELVYAGDPDAEGNPIPAGDPRVTAERVENAQGGSTARFSLARAASTSDFLVPTQGQEGRHEIALRFLPPSAAQADAGQPANYLASADPVEDPSVPRAEVAIEPIDPNPTVTPKPDPDCKDPDFPAPSVETGPGEPDDPAADPSEPGDKNYHGSITTTWGEPSEDNPHPGRVTLKVETPSTGRISVTDASGNVFDADFLKDADGRPVRGEDGTYTLVLDPTAVGRGQLTFRQEPNGAYTGSTWVYDVTVNPDVTVAPAPGLSKEAENLTHPDGPTQPGDRIRYTVTAANAATGSLWTDVVMRDPLPACLELDEGSVRLDNPRGGVAGKALAKAPLVAASDVGKFALSAPGADGRRVLTVPAGDVPGGAEATVTFECTVAIDAAGEGAAAADLANIAEATGTRPDPTDPDNPMPDPNRPGQPLPINPDPTDPVTPPGPGRVVPADPAITLTKTVENLTTPGASVTRIGDRLLYTVTLANTGAANSCLVGAVISDPLPVGIEPAAGTIQLAVNGGTPVPVPDGAYDRGTRTIAVTCGDLWGGGSAALTFEAAVEADALGQDAANIAHAHGGIPSEDPGSVPSGPDPGKPTEPPADEPIASSDPAEPPTIIPDDPGRDDLSIAKTAENASRDDGTTHVGDTVRYRIALANSGPATGWMDAVIRDDVPHGLEPIAGTIRLALPDGREVTVDDGAYDPATRILAVAVGHLYGGQEATLSFDALVTKDALDTDIGNIGTGYGTPPSQWDPGRPAPEPGSPFRPEEGWDEYARDHESVTTDPVYPPGVTSRGGVLQDTDDSSTAREKQRSTIAHKLAQTGDALSLALLLPATLALAAGALTLASRRRARRAR